MTGKEEVYNNLKSLKKDISELKNQLNELDKEKESWFKKKEESSKKISALISQVKTAKKERDKLTNSVKEDKKARDKLNNEIKSNITDIKEINKKKDSAKGKSFGNPNALKREIEKLELFMEIEAITFDKEKKLMKQLKEMKKEY